ncbi:MAG: hypothetical protein OXG36_01085 [Caldilineaceae bacterium]|nr:hypothetical protein [Caldilineaceae bacterium]
MKQVQFFHSGDTDSNDPPAEAAREVETPQEHFDRLLAEQRAEGWAAGMVEGILGSFRRGLAASGLDRRLVEAIEAHAECIVEAAWRGTHFDLDDIPDSVRLLATVQEGDGPTRVLTERIWALLPPIPEDDTAPS